MIGVVATVKVREGSETEFERLFLERSANVRQHEPGCLMYQLTRSRSTPREYKVLELFRSQADVERNTDTDYFRASREAFAACVAEPPLVEYLDAVS